MKRRDFLGWTTAVSGAYIFSDNPSIRNSTADYSPLNHYSGVPDYFFSEDFQSEAEEDFENFQTEKIKRDEPNLFIDLRPVDIGEIAEEFREDIENWFQMNGVSTLCSVHSDTITSLNDEHDKENIYRIIGGMDNPGKRENLYSKVDKIYKNAAVQVFLVPWDIAGPDGTPDYDGVAAGTRAAVEYTVFRDESLDITYHEILHCIGLEHSDEPDNIMHPHSEGGSLSSEQWDYVRDQLS